MKLINLEQNTPEWKEFRKLRIGASDAAAIMGESPWQTPYQWWESKIMGREVKENDAMRKGKELEPIALAKFNLENQLNRQDPWAPAVGTHDEYDWLMASFDGWNGINHVEIKCPGESSHRQTVEEGKIPAHYYAQIQHQMLVSGTKECFFFSYRENEDGKDSSIYFLCKRNEEYCKKLLEAEKEMYRRLVDFDPPAFTDKDVISKEADPKWAWAAAQWKKTKEDLKAAEDAAEYWRSHLIDLAGGVSCEGFDVRVKKVVSEGSIDYKAIYEAVPEIHELINKDVYRKPNRESWRIT